MTEHKEQLTLRFAPTEDQQGYVIDASLIGLLASNKNRLGLGERAISVHPHSLVAPPALAKLIEGVVQGDEDSLDLLTALSQAGYPPLKGRKDRRERVRAVAQALQESGLLRVVTSGELDPDTVRELEQRAIPTQEERFGDEALRRRELLETLAASHSLPAPFTSFDQQLPARISSMIPVLLEPSGRLAVAQELAARKSSFFNRLGSLLPGRRTQVDMKTWVGRLARLALTDEQAELVAMMIDP